MRVNVDSQALTDPRIDALAARLKIHRLEVIGRMIPVWMSCYERRLAVIKRNHVDAAAQMPGFAAAMIAEELADDDTTVENPVELGIGGDHIYIRGVTERIEFLKKQEAKGRLSGEARREKAERRDKRRSAQRGLFEPQVEPPWNISSTNGSTGLGSTAGSTYSLAPDQAPDQAPDHPGDRPNLSTDKVELSTGRVESAMGLRPYNPVSGDTRSEKIDSEASQTASRTRKSDRPRKEVPEAALTAAWMLIDYVIRNSPGAKIARASESDKERTALNWGDTFRLMHERDRIAYNELTAMIHWSQSHQFWQTVILSADNLRAHWDKMTAQRNNLTKSARPVPNGKTSVMRELYNHVEEANAKEPAE